MPVSYNSPFDNSGYGPSGATEPPIATTGAALPGVAPPRQGAGKGKRMARQRKDRAPQIPPSPHVGIDEAGRGCLAGPVVSAAVLLPHDLPLADALPELDDSKKLSAQQRGRLAVLIMEKALACGIGFSWQDEIDRVNILNATFLSMCRAVLSLAARLEEQGTIPLPPLVVDGNYTIPAEAWQSCAQGASAGALLWEQYLPLPATRLPLHVPAMPGQTCVIGGDALVPAVSAASILAKTARDGLMLRMDEFYPGYGLAAHKGYPTREHLEALRRKGPCLLHRMSFRGVRAEQATLF